MTTAARSLPVRNPRTGADDCTIQPLAEPALVDLARRLRAAQPAWAASGAAHRSTVLRAWVDGLMADHSALLDALATDTGRRRLAREEFATLSGIVAGYAALAGALLRPSAEKPSVAPGIVIDTQLVPYPLVGVISPWNFPFLLSMLDAIPALMAGCAVIVKPSEVTPRFISPLMASVRRHPELAGVFAMIEGDGATGAALVGAADFICFTGSVATGRKVAECCARHFIPCCLELGGKDPAIVLASAEPELAAAVVLRASVQATGQACQSLERVYVDRRIHDAFLAALLRQAAAVELSWPDASRGNLGPLIFAKQADIIAAQLDDARARGAKILTGGAIERHGGGSWLRPTVVTQVDHTMKLLTEETFGPVIPVMSFDDLDSAVALANDSVYGLSAAVIGDEAEARAVAARLAAGAVSINDGGLTTEAFDAEKNSFRLSGMGPSRLGASGLTRFLRRRAVLIRRGAAKRIGDFDESGAQR